MEWQMDQARADRIIKFIETLRVPDGALVGQYIQLRPFQREIITEVYAPTGPDGRRVVRTACMSIGKKNAKTALVAALILAHMCVKDLVVPNNQLYSLAYDHEQAAIVFKYASAMIQMDDELSDRFNIIDSRKKLIERVSGSEFAALSGEKKGKHGKSAGLVAFDELADFGSDGTLYDALMTARGAHKDSLAWIFSTQSPDDNAILSQLIDYGLKVQEGTIEDPSFKLFLYWTPPDLDPWDEQNWYLANPALGGFKNLESMRDEAQKAQNMPSREASFR